MTTFCYCFASGEVLFGGYLPKGALIIDKQTAQERAAEERAIENMQKAYEIDPRNNPYPPQSWEKSLRAKCRLAYDGETLLVPGIPEADNQREALEALHRFINWAVKRPESKGNGRRRRAS